MRIIPSTEVRARHGSFLLALIFGLVFAAAGMAQTAEAQNPELSLELMDHAGQLHRLEDYRGKIVVLNFWATWCGPCAKEMPIFVDVQNRFGARGVVVLAASLDAEETKQNIPKFVKKYKMTFPVLVDATADHLLEATGGESLPATVFLDAEGHIFSRILGEAKKKNVFQRVEWLLGERKGKEPEPLLSNLPKGG